MKVRHKIHHTEAWSSRFNISSLNEIIVTFDDGEQSSEYMRDWEAWISTHEKWMPIGEALKSHDIITDNDNTAFFEPRTQEDRERGYTL
jgi:hypothetical protein